MDANSLRELQEKDAAGWQRITAYLDTNAEARIHGDDSDPWTSADLYADLARRLDHTSTLLEAQRDGSPAPETEGTTDEINARWIAEDAGIDLTTARSRAVSAHDRYLAAVSSLPLDRWTKQLADDAMYDGWDHYDQHLAYIEGRTEMNAANVAEMLRKDREEWAALTALLEADPDRAVHQDGHDWTARDVYSHFARWLEHSTNDFEATLRGGGLPRPDGTDDEINARWQAEDAKLSLDEARAWAQREFDRRAQVIESLPEDRWTNPLWAIAHADGWEHIAAHRRYVEGA